MLSPPKDFQDAKAPVVDGNLQSRSLLASQLRTLGVSSVLQCGRVSEARPILEFGRVDFLLFEPYFAT